MATETEVTPAKKVLPLKREPKGTNRMAGEAAKGDGENAVNDALLIIIIAWAIVFALAFSLRDFIS